MDGQAVHLLRLCPDPSVVIPEERWQTIEAQIHEALTFGVERFILDFTGAETIRPLDYWMLLNLAILIPAGQLVVVCDEALFTRSLTTSKLTYLISIVPHLADAYALLAGAAAGAALPGPVMTPQIAPPLAGEA